MKNNFKQLEPDQEAPANLKLELESSLGFFRNAGRILDLYLGKIAWIFAGFMRNNYSDEGTLRGPLNNGTGESPKKDSDSGDELHR